tara:strand:+ start:709 stop:1188 length:480 start_codon:yes stop_codon:yes gene_type:complete
MDVKIIKSSRDIDMYFKIRTKYEQDKMITYFKSQGTLIKEECSCNIPLIIKDINIKATQTEKHIHEAFDISYSELDIHKYIYIKLTYGYEYDVNKEYNRLLIKYLQNIIDKYTVKYINAEKEKEYGAEINKLKITRDEMQTKFSNLNLNNKNKRRKKKK